MKKKLLVLITVVVLLGAAVPFVVVTKFAHDCSNKGTQAVQDKQSQIIEFNKIAFLGENPPVKSNLQKSGDCVDSSPGASVTKEYRLTMTGSMMVDKIRQNLKTSGYTITKEDFGREGCKVLYRAQAANDSIKVSLVAGQRKLKDPSCTDGYPTGISEQEFGKQNVDFAQAALMSQAVI